ncbi:MAG: HU family DNA-binding protein [Acidobacteria bacterium]|nr:HU family DNA-binding protein [Acidobacteriota bacterium]MCB9398586.1 HU family DNA-binding protein [Acidobacteriota bacterium]
MSESLTKNEIISQLHQRHGGIPREQMQQTVDALIGILRYAIYEEGNLLISGFGSFKAKAKKVRTVRLPKGTVAEVQGKRIQFIPASQLKKAINGD